MERMTLRTSPHKTKYEGPFQHDSQNISCPVSADKLLAVVAAVLLQPVRTNARRFGPLF